MTSQGCGEAAYGMNRGPVTCSAAVEDAVFVDPVQLVGLGVVEGQQL